MRSTFLTRTRKLIGASALAILVGLGGGSAFLAASSPMAAAQVVIPAAQITVPAIAPADAALPISSRPLSPRSSRSWSKADEKGQTAQRMAAISTSSFPICRTTIR